MKQESKVSELQNQLVEVEKDLSLRQLLWEATEEWQHLHAQWNATVFSMLDVVLLQKEVSRFVQTIYLLEKSRCFVNFTKKKYKEVNLLSFVFLVKYFVESIPRPTPCAFVILIVVERGWIRN